MAAPQDSFPAFVHGSGSGALFSPTVVNTLGSVSTALRELPAWRQVLAYDQLAQRTVFRREPPFGPPSPSGLVGHAVRDRDIDLIRRWFEDSFDVVVSKQTVVDAARMVAHENAFHPIAEHLLGLTWDGVPRVDRWLEDYCAVVPRSDDHARLVRTVARRWLISCVARAMAPGSKVDTMLILEGAQGIGKSTALATLAGEGRFCDSAIDFASAERKFGCASPPTRSIHARSFFDERNAVPLPLAEAVCERFRSRARGCSSHREQGNPTSTTSRMCRTMPAAFPVSHDTLRALPRTLSSFQP